MRDIQRTLSPVDGSVVAERELATEAELDRALEAAARAQRAWRATPLADRVAKLTALADRLASQRDVLAAELTMQMGRPSRYAAGELGGFDDRARTMLRLAGEALTDLHLPEKPGFTRLIRREPLGVVLVLSPWNYPWLTAVNAVIPALAAGNTVLLKHSDQTPLVAERLVEAGREAGLPEGVLDYVHCSHALVAKAVADPRVGFVAFTGSVEGGHAVHRAAAERFIATGLELGGKDPAYVCEDADLERAIVNVADGVFFNTGQSCCAVERIYVHEKVYDDFVAGFVEETRKLVVGDPRERETTLGPVVRVRNAEAIRAQVEAAVAAGARALLTDDAFGPLALPYLAPQVLVEVTHGMAVMSEETFGPVVGIMPVSGDEEAVRLMNDSRYGLTASIWTPDLDRAARLGDLVETGTVFMNRCDYLDPELAWVGVKDSGRGCTLSRVGYEHLTRPKSFHLRHVPG